MGITSAKITRVCEERQIFQQLPQAQARVLELECGNTEKNRLIASSGQVA